MEKKTHFTAEQAKSIGDQLNIDWNKIPLNEFRVGLEVELEHGLQDEATNVTGNDPILTAKIALSHLNAFSDYYTRLYKGFGMEVPQIGNE